LPHVIACDASHQENLSTNISLYYVHAQLFSWDGEILSLKVFHFRGLSMLNRHHSMQDLQDMLIIFYLAFRMQQFPDTRP